MRISDISVSRKHAEIRRVNGEFYLKDLKSKFGTLVQCQQPICVQPGKTLSLQAGRTLLKVSLNFPSYCGCCVYSCTINIRGGEEDGEATATREEIEEMMWADSAQFGHVPGITAEAESYNERTVYPSSAANVLPAEVQVHTARTLLDHRVSVNSASVQMLNPPPSAPPHELYSRPIREPLNAEPIFVRSLGVEAVNYVGNINPA